jgi:hypothetical protein
MQLQTAARGARSLDDCSSCTAAVACTLLLLLLRPVIAVYCVCVVYGLS